VQMGRLLGLSTSSAPWSSSRTQQRRLADSLRSTSRPGGTQKCERGWTLVSPTTRPI
jgi:hypothetical protein